MIARGLAGLDEFTIVEDDMRRLEACQSPVWDTALALIALRDAGLPEHDPAVESAAPGAPLRKITLLLWGGKKVSIEIPYEAVSGPPGPGKPAP